MQSHRTNCTAVLRKSVLLLAAILAGCSSPSLRPGADDPARVTTSINLSGFPPEYKRGFAAGCEYARNASGQYPKGDAALVQGWKDGKDYCSTRTPR
jgi:hypothetical protein